MKTLFIQDEKLSKTIPTRSYPIDEDRLQIWLNNQCSNNATFNYIHITFDEWRDGLADVIEKLFNKKSHIKKHTFIVSTGLVYEGLEQSASELWMNYIFKLMAKLLGYTIYNETKYWYYVSKSPNENNFVDIVFMDDFIRSGIHMSQRLVFTPDLGKLLENENSTIFIVAPISPGIELLSKPLNDMIKERIRPGDVREKMISRIEVIRSISPDSDHILLDHNSAEKYDDELSYGYINTYKKDKNLKHCGLKMPLFMGSLVKGADPLNTTRYPPPLYHIVFGKGKLPKNSLTLKPHNKFPQFFDIVKK